MKPEHYAIKQLQQVLKGNPSADWARSWTDCLAYQCSCKSCLTLLKKNNADIAMLDDIFTGIHIDKKKKEDQAKNIGAVIKSFIIPVELDTYRLSLFTSWKIVTDYKGELQDLIIEAVDKFFEEKGVRLEYVQSTKTKTEKKEKKQ